MSSQRFSKYLNIYRGVCILSCRNMFWCCDRSFSGRVEILFDNVHHELWRLSIPLPRGNLGLSSPQFFPSRGVSEEPVFSDIWHFGRSKSFAFFPHVQTDRRPGQRGGVSHTVRPGPAPGVLYLQTCPQFCVRFPPELWAAAPKAAQIWN